jgi:Ca2+-binding EF-hand superfamily protein
MLKGILSEALNRKQLEAARMRVLNAGLRATKEFVHTAAMKESGKAIQMAYADAAAFAIFDKLQADSRTDGEEMMADMDAAFGSGSRSGGGKNLDIDSAIEFEFGTALKSPVWQEIVEHRPYTIRLLRELHSKLIALDDSAGNVTEDSFVKEYSTLPGDHSTTPTHAQVVIKQFNPSGEGNTLNVAAYFACLAMASDGDEGQKLALMFELFDTDGSGALGTDEVATVARALGSVASGLGAVDDQMMAEAMMVLGATSTDVDQAAFVDACLEHPAVSKLVQRAFLVVLAKPPKSSGMVSQLTQQATVARRRVVGLKKDGGDAAGRGSPGSVISEDAESISSVDDRAEIEKMEAALAVKKAGLVRKLSLKSEKSGKAEAAAQAKAAKAQAAAEAKAVKDAAHAAEKAVKAEAAAAKQAEKDRVETEKKEAKRVQREKDDAAAAAYAQRKKEEQDAMRAKQESERQVRLAAQREKDLAKARTAEAERIAARTAAEEVTKQKGLAALAEQRLKGNIQAASTNHELDDWHAHTADADVDMNSEGYRRAMIEKAEREAIAEMTGGSDFNNDDAIMAAMQATNPNAYQETMKRNPSIKKVSGGIISGEATGGPPIADESGGARIIMPDADYLLSMIMTGVDESEELKDGAGRRYHLNNDGVSVFRQQDCIQNPFGGVASDAGTLSRRAQATSDVDRRRSEAVARQNEAAQRSLSRSGTKGPGSKETAF